MSALNLRTRRRREERAVEFAALPPPQAPRQPWTRHKLALGLFLGWIKMQPRLPYVFAHELTHLITAKLSGGRIHDWHVANDHGYVETDKTSVWITLSPYLVPLYTLVVFALYGVLEMFANLHAPHEWHLSSWTLTFQWAWIFYFMAGTTMCFHATFTLEVLAT